jgi:iron complex transport system ATP-binding protein
VLSEVSLAVDEGEVMALVGPNGAGKSSLLAVLAGDLACDTGDVWLHGAPLDRWTTREQSRLRSVMVQDPRVSFPFSVREIVAMGRAPWAGTARADDDEAMVVTAMEQADIVDLADRAFTTLSGGEARRTSLARALAQDAPVLLLDEPTAALDVRHQEGALTTVRRLAAAGTAVAVVLHDLNLAAAYADRIAVLDRGRAVVVGPPDDVLDADLLTQVYGHPLEVVAHPLTGRRLVLPRR